ALVAKRQELSVFGLGHREEAVALLSFAKRQALARFLFPGLHRAVSGAGYQRLAVGRKGQVRDLAAPSGKLSHFLARFSVEDVKARQAARHRECLPIGSERDLRNTHPIYLDLMLFLAVLDLPNLDGSALIGVYLAAARTVETPGRQHRAVAGE